ncbi:MAG TPA: cation-transporting P-type ATPase [Nocardioides sp.]|nr:cation-transporting P-type ATPase [Nocardioides sp.]
MGSLASTALSSAEAARRLRDVGPNVAPAPARRSTALRVADQLRDPMIVLLQLAAVLGAVLRDWPSTVIILAVVVFNTTVGVRQQHRADRVMDELEQMAAPTAVVRRDDELVTVPAGEVVPGDHVSLTAGDLVPADAVVLQSHDLEVDEAPVTGESLPVPHGPGDELVAGGRTTHGRAVVEVTRTGASSSLGRIAALLQEGRSRPTPLQRRLTGLSRGLAVLVVTLTAVVVLIGLVQGRPWGEMLLVGLSLTVAALPESLPAVVTIALAVGAHRMAQRQVIVRALPAVETLGSVTVVATDKTGTITEGRMRGQALWVAGVGLDVGNDEIRATDDARAVPHAALERLLRDVVLCNDATTGIGEAGTTRVAGDPLDHAVLELASLAGLDAEAARGRWPRTGEVPFDHAARRMTTHHLSPEAGPLTVCKGAPEAVLALLPASAADTGAARAAVEDMAGSGLRVIAVADTVDGAQWRLAGLVGIGDPPRASAVGVVRTLQRAGIRLVLVTGDHAGTAGAVARSVGIAEPGDTTVEGDALAEVPPERRHELTVVARVVPEQKVHVVQWLQEAGEVVAMLGDGVNDAPALRRADIGVAAGLTGTGVAKEAADLVLADDELGSVVAAVEEGRRIFANIRSFLLYAVSGGLAEVAVMVAGGLVGLAVPLLPGQILWINLLTHGMVGVAFGSEPLDPRQMAQPPRPPTEPVFTRPALVRLVVVTAALAAAALTAGALTNGSDDLRRTAVFVALGAGQLGVALALRASRSGTGASERGLEVSVLGAALLMAAAVWLAPLQALLGTRALPLDVAAVAVAVAAVPGVLLRVWLRTRPGEGRGVRRGSVVG